MITSSGSNTGSVVRALETHNIRLSDVVSRNKTVIPTGMGNLLSNGLTKVNITRGKCTSFGLSIGTGNNRSSRPPGRATVNRVSGTIIHLRGGRFGNRVPSCLGEVFVRINERYACPNEFIVYGCGILRPLIGFTVLRVPPTTSVIRAAVNIAVDDNDPTTGILPRDTDMAMGYHVVPNRDVTSAGRRVEGTVGGSGVRVRLLGNGRPSLVSPASAGTFGAVGRVARTTGPATVMAPFLIVNKASTCRCRPVYRGVCHFTPFAISTRLLLAARSAGREYPVRRLNTNVSFFGHCVQTVATRRGWHGGHAVGLCVPITRGLLPYVVHTLVLATTQGTVIVG